MSCVDRNLTLYRLEERIMKKTGLYKYLRAYENGKEEFREDIENAWWTYSRVFTESKVNIVNIYQ